MVRVKFRVYVVVVPFTFTFSHLMVRTPRGALTMV